MADYSYNPNIPISVNVSGDAQIAQLKAEVADLSLKLQESKKYSDGLTESINKLNRELERTKYNLEEAEYELDGFKFGSKIKELQEDSNRLADLTERSLSEFKAYLQSVNLDENLDFNMSHLVAEVEEGLKTSQEAIAQVKASYRSLIEENYDSSGGLFDSQQVRAFTASLDTLSARIDGIVEQVAKLLQTGTVQTGGVAGVGAGLKEVVDSTLSLGQLSGDESNALLKIVEALNTYASVDSDKLKSVAVALDRIAALSEVKVSSATVANIVSLATSIQELNKQGSVMLQFDVVGLKGLNDIKVRKPTVDNIKDLFQFFEDHSSSVDTLDRLANIDFSKLSSIPEVDFEKLKVLPDNTETQATLNAEGTTIDAITGKYQKHVEIVEKAIAAENEKGRIAELVALGLKSEAAALAETTTEAKKNEASIDKLAGKAKLIDKSAFGLIRDALTDNGANSSDADDLANKITSSYKDIDGQIVRVTANVDKLGSTEARVANVTIDKIDEAGRSYKLYLNYVRDVIKEEGKADRLVWRQTNNKNGGIIKYNFDSEKDDAAVYNKYATAYASITSQMDRLTSAGGNNVLQNALQSYITELNSLYTAYNDTDEGRHKFDIGLTNLSANLKLTIGNINQYIAAQKKSEQAEKDVAAQTKLRLKNDATRAELEGKITKAINDYSGAQRSSNKESRDAYNNIQGLIGRLSTLSGEVSSGTKTQEQYETELESINTALRDNTNVLVRNGNATKSWSSQFKDMAKQLSQWVTPMRILMKVIQYVKKMVSASIELNDAMTQMQIVTRASDAEMAKFGETAAAAAKRIGSSITDFVSSATTYARLGYNTEESSMFAEYTAMLQNVGDIGVEDAQNAVTAIVKAYSIAPDELKRVMDEMVTIGNGFPISVAQIAEGMNNASSTLAAAGNSFEQSVALLTAANTTVQNASKAATGLRTITARLRNTKADLEELGEDMTEAKYEELVKTLTGVGVTLTDVNNNYRSTYDIMKDIADAWDKMNDERKSALVTQLAGTRQQDIFYSIINNFREAEEAYGEMVNNSTGALDTAYSTYMNSATAHINQFKAAFQELSANFIDSKLVADAADIGSFFVKALNWVTQLLNKVGGLKTLLIAIAGVIATIKIDGLKNAITLIPKFLSGIKLGITSWRDINKGGKDSIRIFDALSGSLEAVGIEASAAQLALGALVAVITIAVIAYSKWKQAEEERIAKAKEAANNAVQETEELITLISKYNDLRKAIDDGTGSREEFIDVQDQLLESLDLEKEKIKELITKYGDYESAIRHATIEKLQEDEVSIRAGINASESELVTAAWKSGSLSEGPGEIARTFGAGSTNGMQAIKKLSDLGYNVNGGIFGFTINLPTGDLYNPDDIIKLYNTLGDMLKSIDDISDSNPVYDALYDRYSKLSSYVKEYQSSISNLNTNLAEQTMLEKLRGNELPKTQAEFETMRKSMIDAAINSKEFIGSEEDIEKAIDGVLRKESGLTEFYQKFDEEEKRALERSGRIKGIWENLIPKDKEKKNWVDYIQGLDDDEIKIVYDIVRSDKSLSLDELKEKVEEIKAQSQIEIETKSDTDIYSQIQKLDDGFKKLGEVYSDVQDQGSFDWSKIINNDDFRNAFKDCTDSYDTFVETVAESNGDLSACQKAFNQLAYEFLVNSGALDGLTESSRETAVALLEQKGVANAAEIVDAAIQKNAGIINTLTTAYQNATGKTYDFKNATEAEVLALYNEQAAGSVAQKVVAQLYLEKRNLNNTQINTANDVEQILNIAKAAGAGAQYLINLQDALNHLDNIPTKFYDENGNVLTKKKDIVAARQRYIQDYLKVANNATKDMDFEIAIPDVNWTGYGGANTSSKGTSAGKTKTAEEQAQDAFLLEYKRHKHLVEMEQETQQQFFDWLDSAYKKVYKAGTEEYWKYEEEVMSGYRNLFKDITSDLEHEISMREMFDGEAKAIDGIYVTLIQKVEAQLALMRGKGLKDTDDYIQELQKLWQKYVNDRKKLRDDTADKAKDALDALIDYRVKKLKQDIENERDALKKRLDATKEFYDKQKELLRDQRDEEKYLDEQSEKRKAVRDIEKQLNQLALDDSAWAQKKKLELSNELANAQKELSEFERDHAIDMAEDQLDKQYELIEDNYNKQDELLEKKLNNEKLLRDQALEDLRTNSAAIYAEILQWNIEYGDGITNTITSAWEEAYTALKDYKTLYGQLYNNVDLANMTGVNTGASWDTVKPSDKGSKSGVSGVSYSASSPSSTSKSGTPGNGDINGDGKVNAEDARLALNAAVKKISLTADQIRRGDINGDGKITADDASKILKKAVKMGYASGTHSAVPGLHMIDENGDETIFQSKDGNKYKLFAGGEKVLNAKASDFLYRFANGGVDILKNAVGDALRSNFVNLFTKGSGDIEISTGNIIIQGNADKATVSEIRRAQREQLDTILNTFNKLKA